jgi:hypothetical protein
MFILGREVYTAKEMANLLSVSVMKIYEWARSAKDPIPVFRSPGGKSGRILCLKKDFEDWVNRHFFPSISSKEKNER